MSALSESATVIDTTTANRIDRRLLVLISIAGFIAVGVLVALVLQKIDIGSKRGNWTFDYNASWLKNGPTLWRRFDWKVIASVLGGATVLAGLAPHLIQRWERLTLLLSLVAGVVLQTGLRSVYKHSLERLIKSWGANSFWTAAHDNPLSKFVYEFDTVGPTLVGHARHNMPGKVLLYYGLELFTKDVPTLGVMVIALSTLAGLFVYLLTRELTGDRQTAIAAFALYCVIPSRVSFLPILNVVTPLFIFAALWLLVRALKTDRIAPAALVGIMLYLTLLFEPLPLVMGIVFALLVLRYKWDAPRRWRSIGRLVLIVALAFLAVHVLILALFHFDILKHFARLLAQAKHFNVETDRAYKVWLTANLAEFFLTCGVAASLLMFISVLDSLLPGEGRWWQRLVRSPVVFLSFAFLLNLLVVDLLGVNRGEVARLWIFFTPFVVIAAAQLCVQRLGLGIFRITFGLMLVQCALQLSTVGFVNP